MLAFQKKWSLVFDAKLTVPLHTGESANQSPVIRQVMISFDDNENPGWHAKKAVELTEILCAKSLQYRYLERRSMDKIFLETFFKSTSSACI